jgi:hypothetical protein
MWRGALPLLCGGTKWNWTRTQQDAEEIGQCRAIECIVMFLIHKRNGVKERWCEGEVAGVGMMYIVVQTFHLVLLGFFFFRFLRSFV